MFELSQEVQSDGDGAASCIVTIKQNEEAYRYLEPPCTWREWIVEFYNSLNVSCKAIESGKPRLANFRVRVHCAGYSGLSTGINFGPRFEFLYIENATEGAETMTIEDKTYNLGHVFNVMNSDVSYVSNVQITEWFEQNPDESFTTILIEITNASGQVLGANQEMIMLAAPKAWIPTFDLQVQGLNLIEEIYYYVGTSGATFSVVNISFPGNATLDSNKSSIEFLGETSPVDETLTVTPIDQSGTLTATAKVVDSRGRSTTKQLSIIAYNHASPEVTYFSALRCDEDGSENPSGTHASVKFEASAVSDINLHTVSFVSLRWRDYLSDDWTEPIDVTTNNGSEFVIPNATFDLDAQYEMMLEVTDDSGQKSSVVTMMFKAFLTIDFLAGGHGLAIGGPASEPGFKCYMDAEFLGKNKPGFKCSTDAEFDGDVVLGKQSTESTLKCHMDAEFLNSVDVGDGNIEVRNLSIDAKNRIFSTPRYNNQDYRSNGYLKIRITKKADWMLSFTLNFYGDYHAYGIRFSGYDYIDQGGVWHSPQATVIYATDNCPDIPIWFGHDGAGELWVAVLMKAYVGLSISDVVRGFRLLEGDIPDKELFEISHISSLSGTIDKSITAEGPLWKRIYPIGALYLSYSSTSPASLFGGSWTQITGRYLRAANDVGTGGADSESINFDHTHAQRNKYKDHSYGSANGSKYTEGETVANSVFAVNRSSWSGGIGAPYEGEKVPLEYKTISRMVSYQNIFVWRRTG